MKKRFNLWLEESELKLLKRKAKKERQSVNGFVLKKVLNGRKKK